MKQYRHKIGFLVLIIGIFLLWYLGRCTHIDIDSFQRPLQKLPLFQSGLLFIILYVLITFFIWFSKDIFWIMGAFLFGPFLSALLVYISEVINAFLLFYLARYLGRGYVDKKLSEKYRRLDEKLGRISFGWLFIFRAAPLIPYRFMDMAAGLTSIDFKKYLAAVLFGSPLKIFWIQYILSATGMAIFNDPYTVSLYFMQNKALLMFSLIYIILVIAVIFKIRAKE